MTAWVCNVSSVYFALSVHQLLPKMRSKFIKPHKLPEETSMTPTPRSTSQPRLRVWWVGAMALALMALVCLQAMPGVDGVRLLIRATARTSLLFFLLAYTAHAA